MYLGFLILGGVTVLERVLFDRGVLGRGVGVADIFCFFLLGDVSFDLVDFLIDLGALRLDPVADDNPLITAFLSFQHAWQRL